MGMYNVARLQAANVAKALDLSQANTLLDLGGGPGTYAAAFCAQYPRLSAVVFDRPTSEPVFQEVILQCGMAQRVSFQGGDFFASQLPTGFDAVWLSQILHGESLEKATSLVQRAAATLNPGGVLAIQEFVLNDERDGPLGPALFSLNMLLQTESGSSYTVSEISQMMEKAGILRISEVSAPLPPGNRIFWGTLGR
jgi:cyclopropane fatty-acyl-phospholipid synthase-like methyltransferase